MSENSMNSTEEIVLSVEMSDSISAQAAEAWAVGQRGGVDVAETDPTWHNNAKYYAEQCAGAEQAAQDAEDAAEQAESAKTAAEAARDRAEAIGAGAVQSATAAAESAQAAATAKTGAETAQSAAAGSATAAEGSAERAGQSATAAGQSATDAGTAKTAAEAARDAAAGSAAAAGQSAQAAAASAQAAEDVAESIPADYSQLSDDVSGLKSALTEADYYFYWTIHDGFIDNQGQIVNPSTSHAEKYTSLIEIPADGKIGVSLNYSEDRSMWFAYVLYNFNQEFISRTVIKSGTAKSDNEIITISNNNAKFISFTFRGFNDYYLSVYNPISDKLNENILDTNSIKNSIGEYAGTFSVQSGVSHSWAADPVTVDIESGETFNVLVTSTAVTGGQIYVGYNDATNERIYSGNVLNQIFVAKKHIVKLGLYIAPQSIISNGVCKLDVIKYGIALSLNSINANYSSSIKSVNHRGFINAPENTLPAYKLSREMGFTYVETDIQWTSDNVPVLLHDSVINRTARNSDGSEISETVSISDITYEQALAYDFGIYKGEQYAGTKIPTFTEFVVLCKRLGLHPYVELKGGSQEQINGLVTIAKRYGMLEDITWISFYTTFLERVKVKHLNARLGYICDTVTSTKIDEAVALKTSENKVFIDANYNNLTTETVESCVDADMPLEVYTVNDINAFITIDAYVSGYTSDKFIGSKLLLEFYS
jgi:glycerophosphoryl diester phosphodiesterase